MTSLKHENELKVTSQSLPLFPNFQFTFYTSFQRFWKLGNTFVLSSTTNIFGKFINQTKSLHKLHSFFVPF